MGPEFANGLFCIFVFFRLCSCASIDLNQVETLRMTGSSSTGSDRWTTLGVEYSSGGYETVNASDPTTHNVEMSTRTKDQMSTRTKDQSNPCLNSDFCIHGSCEYHSDQQTTYCVCHPGFSGQRCHMFILGSTSKEGYDLTTILPVVAVVIVILCLTVFSLFLVIRFV
ncbi:heparin-binding EGF-like growth factor b [Sardina pilchardus]|uniref:heparin-binding EGF-like growth factor b n=1 Tax=Sardina pilchardus TaxID=27697 RepID=UPI002E165EC1